MAASILLITGGTEFARDVYKREGRADWAQAFPLALEKLGYLSVDTAGPEALADPRTWEERAAVLVSRLPSGSWTPRALELVGSGTASLLVELPPQQLRERLGIVSAEPAPREGRVAATHPGLRAVVDMVSTRSNTWLKPPESRPVDRAEELAWNRLGVPIGDEQARCWRAPGWDVERWEVSSDTVVLAGWAEDGDAGGRWPALVYRGSLLACAFSLFGFLGQQTTVQPFERAEHLISPRPFALEAMLTILIDRMHLAAGIPRPRIMPWPEGAGWALNVRHDFDRAQSAADVQRVLDVHAAAGTAATWYWRARHVNGSRSVRDRLRARGKDGAAVARLVSSTPRHEVALHTEQPWTAGERERRAVERASGAPSLGTSAHGDPDCFRWQGAPNVLWAERQGFDYTEFISHAHLHPHRFAALEPDGTVEASRLVCLPHHESLDRSMAPEDVNSESVLEAARSYRRAGGFMQVLNHPDLNLEPLSDVLHHLPDEDRLDLTAAEAADWWRRTHVRGELSLDQHDDGSVTVRSIRGVRGAVLELFGPEGRRRYSLHLEPGGSVTVGGTVAASRRDTGAIGPQARWDETVAPAFTKAARSFYARNGIDPASPESERTLEINSSLVPGRVEAVRRYLGELGGVESLAGARVLDCGAGFGAFAAYLSLERDAPMVTAVEVRPEFAELAREVAAETGVEVDFLNGDMRSLGELPDGHFDVVIVNNAFIYLTSKRDMRRAVAALRRVTTPGGRICLSHANAWQLREPFTRAPLVHLLPAPAAEALGSLTGWEHNHGRVRLISAPALGRILRHVGFDRVRVGAVRGNRIVGPPRAYLGRFYAVVARRAG